MKIKKINTSQLSAYKSILKSMSDKKKITVCNNLDACSCTGNSQC